MYNIFIYIYLCEMCDIKVLTTAMLQQLPGEFFNIY